jgi:hypothetical protein
LPNKAGDMRWANAGAGSSARPAVASSRLTRTAGQQGAGRVVEAGTSGR